MSSLSGEEDETSSDEGEDSSDDEAILPPPPRPLSTGVATNVVTHIRHYSTEYNNHYYTLVSDPDGESEWVPPSTGIVKCTDESSGNVFYTQSSTGKVAWDLNGF